MQTPCEETTSQQPPAKKKEPIFLPRTNGWGWSLNFNRPESCFVLAIIFGAPFAVVLCVILFVK